MPDPSTTAKTVPRLHAVLTGMVPAATATLFATGFSGRPGDVGYATLAVMGLVLGCAGGVPAGLWLKHRGLQPADLRLPLLFGVLSLMLAALPLQFETRPELLGLNGWPSVLAGTLAAVPLGVCMGTSWAIWTSAAGLDWRGRLIWGGVGTGLGAGLAVGAVLVLSVLKGAALINLFAAPLVWPTLPRGGDRSLLARMLLTLSVVVSTMVLLFV